jgi:uncharacterized integral membrane protein
VDSLVGRWVAACLLAEAVGMTAAASSAKVSQALVGEPTEVAEVLVALAVVVGGGLVEGVALGTAQSWALRRTHPDHAHRRFVAATVLFAGLGWAAVSAPAALAGPAGGAGSEPPQVLVVLGGAGLGLLLGALLGAAQAWALRGSVRRPGTWVVANAVAWVPTMAVIFLGATTPDAGWSPVHVALLGTVTGAVAGALLGAVLAWWVPRLGERSAAVPG